MSDLIPDALDNQPEESVATGVVDDNQVAVQKKPKQDNNDIVWDVNVYISNYLNPDTQESGLSEDDAEQIFNSLVISYDLTVRPDVEMCDFSSETVGHTQCEECGGDLTKVSDTVRAGSGVADSYEATW